MLRLLLALTTLALGLPALVVGCLRQIPPPVTAFMLQSETRPVHYVWVPAELISEHARKAVVAAEDQKFWRHRGFDFEAMQQARLENRTRQRKRGASTLSQQTAKNLFLWPGGGYLRKGIEAYLTVLIEWLWPKDRILEVYLNIAEFGPGIYGVEAAAWRYFDKPASRLTPPEAARLAAVLPSPRRWSVQQPGPYVARRSQWVLRQMGHAPRPAAVPDPEPLEPESAVILPAQMPVASDEVIDEAAGDHAPAGPAGSVPAARVESETESLPDQDSSERETAEPPPAESSGSRPRASGGGRIEEDDPIEEGLEPQDSLIL